jgi:hypothetical protein
MDTPTSTPDNTRPKSSRRRSANRFRAAVRRFWQDWWVEILISVLVALAIFLLVERMSIRQTLRAWLVALWHGLQDLISGLTRAVIGRAQAITLSDLVAYVLLVTAVFLVLWRVRRRLMTLPRFTALKCPRCGSEVHRVHRHWHDHVLDLYVPVRRYQCEDTDCRWRGLRVKRSRQR